MTNGPPAPPPRHNGRIEYDRGAPAQPHQPSASGRAETPPWPTRGAALKHAEPSRQETADAAGHQETAEKTHPQGVIHTSYHGGVSQPSSPSQVRGDDWLSHVTTAIATLESQLDSQGKGSASDGDSDASDHARLRILQLLAGRRDDALREMPVDDSAMRDFWSNELFGLDILLDTQRFSRDSHRAAEAKRHLCRAVASLGESATLEIRNLAFCSEVQSYGSIKRFGSREFTPGQRLLLYAEVDNFHSENTAKGYHTSLRSSFQIFDSSGRRVDRRESTTSEEHCQSPRRDYFIGCDFRLPTNIYPGRHTLKLTVEDLKSHKVAESSIDFTVKEK